MLAYNLKEDKYVLYYDNGKRPNYSRSRIRVLLETKYNFNIGNFNFEYKFMRPRTTDFLDSSDYRELFFYNEEDAKLYIDSVNSILIATKLSYSGGNN